MAVHNTSTSAMFRACHLQSWAAMLSSLVDEDWAEKSTTVVWTPSSQRHYSGKDWRTPHSRIQPSSHYMVSSYCNRRTHRTISERRHVWLLCPHTELALLSSIFLYHSLEQVQLSHQQDKSSLLAGGQTHWTLQEYSDYI